jgi:hypothetical protein
MTDGRNELAELCALAAAAAEKQGHELDDWIQPDRDEATGLRAVCRRCGRVVYVRAESSMQGMAGAALREPCSA